MSEREAYYLVKYYSLASNLWILREAYKQINGAKGNIDNFYIDLGIGKQSLNRLWGGKPVFIAKQLKDIHHRFGIQEIYLEPCKKNSTDLSKHLLLDTGRISDWDIFGENRGQDDNEKGDGKSREKKRRERERKLIDLLTDKLKEYEEGAYDQGGLYAFWSYYAHPMDRTLQSLDAISTEEWKRLDTASLETNYLRLKKQLDVVETILKYRKL